MSDESLALTFPTPPAPEGGYDAICAAVMETDRGRWFLAEFARRNRHADTQMLVAALERIEAAIRPAPAPAGNAAPQPAGMEETDPPAAAFKPSIVGRDATHTDGESKSSAAQNLAHALENATAAIRGAIEHLQDIAWSLREGRYDDRFCDGIDARTSEISRACVVLDVAAIAAHDVAALVADMEARVDQSGLGAPPPTKPQPDVQNIASGRTPQDSALAFRAARPEENTAIWEGLSPWDETPEIEAQPAEPSVSAMDGLPKTVWDERVRVDTLETETVVAVSSWDLRGETKTAEPEAKPSASDAETQDASMPQDISPPEKSQPVAGSDASEVPKPERSDQALFSPAIGYREPPRGWLSTLISRKPPETVLEEIPEDKSASTYAVADVDRAITAPAPPTNSLPETNDGSPDRFARRPEPAMIETAAVAEAQPEAGTNPGDLPPEHLPAAMAAMLGDAAAPAAEAPIPPRRHDPLAPIRQMSDEEKIALFS